LQKVNIHEAKTTLSKLVDRANAGEEILIAKSERPVAKLVPLKERRKHRKKGRLEGKIWIADDFDEPLPEEVLAALGAKTTP
jgi:prevent-host-death family protein